jgi:hypothetical protein
MLNKEPTMNLKVAVMRIGCGLLVWLACPLAALAYRPFFSTDAAVTDQGVSEMELGIFDFTNHRGQNALAVPAVRYNLGFAPNWEIAAEGALQVYDSASSRDMGILDPQLNLKGVLLEGPLQEGRSPISLALEIGALLPETVRDSGVGFQSVLVGSFRTGEFTWHVNVGGGLERESLDLVGVWGIIIERPFAKALRIAVELNGESTRGSGPANSALLALLWDHRKVTYDAGVRFGLSKAAPDVAFTMGLTLRF